MATISLKNNELQFLLDAILEKNISTRLDYGIAKITLRKLIKQWNNETLANNYLDNFQEVNKKWKIDD